MEGTAIITSETTDNALIKDLHAEIVQSKALQHMYAVETAQMQAIEQQNQLLVLLIILTVIGIMTRWMFR